MTNAIRTLYRYWSALLLAAVLTQVGLAGYGAFAADHKADDNGSVSHHLFDHGFAPHVGLGYVIFLGTIVLLLLSLLGRSGRTVVLRSLGLALLVLLAIVLAIAGGDHPIVGIFHPVVAFGVVGLAGLVARTAWSGRRAAAP
jgi:hypothetical protein